MNLNPLRPAGTGLYSEDPMLLTLEVVSPNGASLGPNRRKTVGPEGMQIGRGKENDWVIDDRYISRVHARIRYVNGAFYVEGLGRNPLAINDSQNAVQNNDPQLLRSGDRFFLDQFEIKATLSAGDTAAHREDPFSVEPAATARGAPKVPEEWGEASPSHGVEIQDAERPQGGTLDPIDVLGGPTSRPAAPPRPINLQPGVLEESYHPQQPITPAGGETPDTLDPRKRGAPQTPARGAIPTTWAGSGLTHIEPQRPATRSAPPSSPPPPIAKPAVPQTIRRPAQPPRPDLPKTVAERPASTPRAAARPETPRPSVPQVPQSSSLSLEHLLAAAGVQASEMTPELAAEFGEVFRIVVQGVMEVLQSRSEIKSQLRMSMTRMKPTENNPLKFSPNVEAALHTLLVERNRGYLSTTRAFQEAFTDVRDHQIAVLQGIRAAFDAMLEQFDPERIEEEMNRSNSRGGGLLNVGAKSRFRDFYFERFARLTGDRDESFRRLFGEYFAQAYEEQMDRLKATARTSGG
jgi:type VI secretion system FHA domain protein